MTKRKLKLKVYDWDSLKQEKELGNGSFGKVWLLLNKNSNKYVIGKYMSSDGDESLRQNQLSRAKSEAETHAAIQHENIIRLSRIASQGNTLFCFNLGIYTVRKSRKFFATHCWHFNTLETSSKVFC